MADVPAFAKLVPGFDFLQNLVQNAGSALPNIGQWIAPTLNPEELGKRIEELRTVQFWLEQNARMLGTTIQALEVQRMTLSTLKTMNVQMEDLRQSLTIRVPDISAPAPAPKAASAAPAPAPAPAPTPAEPSPAAAKKEKAPASKRGAAQADTETTAAGAVDPMQWWSALTKQFTTLAANAMKEGAASAAGAANAAKGLATSMVKQPADAKEQPPGVPAKAPKAARKAPRAKAPKPAAE
jgi:hypothetical protein